MRDPHVECLRYRLTVDETYGRFDNPSPLEHETDVYRMRLEGGVLTVEMKEHHATVESAKERVENDLRAWELDAALSRDHTWLRFDHDPSGAKIIDRDPPPPGAVEISVSGVAIAGGVGSVTAVAAPPVFKEYPKPPTKLKSSLDVEGLFRRYERAVWLDPTQMLAIGYLWLSYLEGTTAKKGRKAQNEAAKKERKKRKARNEAAKMYKIELDVLDKLGDLTSTRGDLQEARKLDAGATRLPLSPEEKGWVRAVIKRLIRRKAEYDSDPDAVQSLPITMSDFPAVSVLGVRPI